MNVFSLSFFNEINRIDAISRLSLPGNGVRNLEKKVYFIFHSKLELPVFEFGKLMQQAIEIELKEKTSAAVCKLD